MCSAYLALMAGRVGPLMAMLEPSLSLLALPPMALWEPPLVALVQLASDLGVKWTLNSA